MSSDAGRQSGSGASPITTSRDGTAMLRVRVVPRGGRTGLAGIRDGSLLIRLAAAPVDGAANAALIGYLAERLDLPRRRLRIVAGERSRSKRIAVDGVSEDFVARRLRTSLSPSGSVRDDVD